MAYTGDRCHYTGLGIPECACPSCALALVRDNAPHLVEQNVHVGTRARERAGVMVSDPRLPAARRH